MAQVTFPEVLVDKNRWKNIYSYIHNWGGSDGKYNLSEDDLKNYLHNLKLVVIGAGGLGCEILKDLALSGFVNIYVLDMDTIEVSNLNRQFLFTQADVGKAKAEVAANFINKRVKGCHVIPDVKDITTLSDNFYSQFDIVVGGLDSLTVRRWMSATLVRIAKSDKGKIIPYIDGASEGHQGTARVILPLLNPCFECRFADIPPELNVAMCTIANTPRTPAHCVEWGVIKYAEKHGHKADGDDVEAVDEVYKIALERANLFGIEGVTPSFTLGVVKHIIPAIASTNSFVSAVVCNEVLKLGIQLFLLKNYLQYNGTEGIAFILTDYLKNDKCLACSDDVIIPLTLKKDINVKSFVHHIVHHPSVNLSSSVSLMSSQGVIIFNNNTGKNNGPLLLTEFCDDKETVIVNSILFDLKVIITYDDNNGLGNIEE